MYHVNFEELYFEVSIYISQPILPLIDAQRWPIKYMNYEFLASSSQQFIYLFVM